jgi:hypothetical protein
MAHHSYAKICLHRAGGVLSADNPDPNEFIACTTAAQTAEDQDVVVDTPAITVLLTLPDDVRKTVVARFARLMTTDDVVGDALNAKGTLAFRNTASWRYDEQQDRLLLDETAEAETDQLALEANRLHDAIEALTRLTPPTDRTLAEPHTPALTTWASSLDLARAEGATLWSDDPALRALARGVGVPATSTQAVLQHLASLGVITDDQLEPVSGG